MSDAFNYNHDIQAGTTYDQTLTWKAGTPPTPVNLTGCSAKSQFRSADGTLMLEMSTANNRLVLGGVNGTIQFKLTAAETTALAWLQTIHDLLITFADGTVKRKVYGVATVTRGVTQ